MTAEIRPLPRAEYEGFEFTVEYTADRFYDVERLDEGFRLKLTECAPMKKGFADHLFGEWLEEPVAFGAFEGERLLGFIEGSVESWHNVFRISNVFVYPEARRTGVGSMLIRHMIDYARTESGCRAVILETQSCNFPAISLYKKHGFRLCRIDIGEYTNHDVENREVRIDLMLKF